MRVIDLVTSNYANMTQYRRPLKELKQLSMTRYLKRQHPLPRDFRASALLKRVATVLDNTQGIPSRVHLKFAFFSLFLGIRMLVIMLECNQWTGNL
jgi:hypothetical protein